MYFDPACTCNQYKSIPKMSYCAPAEANVPLTTGLPINLEMRGEMSTLPTGVLPLIWGQCIFQKLSTLWVWGSREAFNQVTRDPLIMQSKERQGSGENVNFLSLYFSPIRVDNHLFENVLLSYLWWWHIHYEYSSSSAIYPDKYWCDLGYI